MAVNPRSERPRRSAHLDLTIMHLARSWTHRIARAAARFSFIASLVAVALASGSASRAAACDCTAQSVTDAYAQASAVFEGRVVEAREPADRSSVRLTRVELQVVRAWKGIETEHAVIATPSDSDCGLELEPGQSYLVYATLTKGELNADACSRTRPMPQADADIRELGMGATPVDPRVKSEEAKKPAPPANVAPRRGGCASCSVARSVAPDVAGPLACLAACAAFARVTSRRRSGSRS